MTLDLNLYPYIIDRDGGIPYPEPGETFLDCVPSGWVTLFLAMCNDISRALEAEGIPKSAFHFLQVKEKFGALRVYWKLEDKLCEALGNEKASAIKEKISDAIIDAEGASMKTCSVCGSSAKYTSTGWVRPYCQHCAQSDLDARNARHKTSYTLEETYQKIEK